MKMRPLLVFVTAAFLTLGACAHHRPPGVVTTTAVPVTVDSNAAPGGLYDFYYSARQAQALSDVAAVNGETYTPKEVLMRGSLLDTRYTECVPAGQPVRNRFNDNRLVASGVGATCTPF